MVIMFHQDGHLKESDGFKRLLENFANEIVDQIIFVSDPQKENMYGR